MDSSAFMLTDSGKCPSDKEFIFYGNLSHPCGAVVHQEDNFTGAGDGDDEQIKIDLSKMSENITKVAFVVNL